MNEELREARISAAFVAASNTLTSDFDEVELLHALLRDCVEILEMKAGGLLLADAAGELQLVTSTSDVAAFVEVMQLGADSGPCIDCYTRGERVSLSDIADDASSWPAFKQAALAQGIHSVLATPMRLRGKVIGTLNLFGEQTGHVSERDAAVAQALADVASIGLLQERVVRESQVVEDQLQRALDSRIMIEQAKGVLAGALSVSMDEAFAMLRKYCRDRNLTIRAVAESLNTRELTAQELGARVGHTVA